MLAMSPHAKTAGMLVRHSSSTSTPFAIATPLPSMNSTLGSIPIATMTAEQSIRRPDVVRTASTRRVPSIRSRCGFEGIQPNVALRSDPASASPAAESAKQRPAGGRADARAPTGTAGTRRTRTAGPVPPPPRCPSASHASSAGAALTGHGGHRRAGAVPPALRSRGAPRSTGTSKRPACPQCRPARPAIDPRSANVRSGHQHHQ